MTQVISHPAVSADGCWYNLRLAPELYVSEVADIPEGTLACLVVQQGRMVWVGPQDAMPAEYQALPRHDGAGRLATPGLIDCHTHLVYGGERANEFAMRLAGAIGLISWLSIDLLRLCWRESDDIPWPRGMRGMAVVPLGIAAGLILGNPLGSLYVQQFHPELSATARPSLWLPLAITMATSMAMSWGFYVVGKSRHLQMQAEQAQRQAAEARLSLLQAQLEPHMLFNTLANLRVLIATDAPRAEQMLDHLIAYLRATLAGSRHGTHSLACEFALLADYLALMQIRMGERLSYGLHLPAELAELHVPTLLLQPLVENSIRHGLEPQLAGGHIAVHASMLDDSRLLLSVHDNGLGLPMLPGQPPSGSRSGFGLQQIRERLASRYGGAARFDLTADSAGGTRACIVLPLKSQP